MNNIRIWVVVPTIRAESFKRFLDEWMDIFLLYEVILVKVTDGEVPELWVYDHLTDQSTEYLFEKDPTDPIDSLFYNFNDGIRNLGFYYVALNGSSGDIIWTLDDDCYPEGPSLEQHLSILGTKQPISWLSTASEYMRGFPYNVRNEAEVLVSHGTWYNVPDLDAPTQLVKGTNPNGYTFPITVVPKGIYFPFCIMNVAFKYEALPYMYQAPAGRNCPHGIDRFADIWCGINLVRYAQEHNFAIATGYSRIWHDRASNVFENLKKEAKGLQLNETYWTGVETDPYFELYNHNRKLWENTIKQIQTEHSS